jgi:hypothetical protein
VKDLAKKLKEAQKLAWDNTESRKETQKKYHDRRSKPVEFPE